MAQTEILKLLEKEGSLFGTEIIEKLRKNGETKEWLRGSLKQLRAYNEVKFVEVNFKNVADVAMKFDYVKKKIDNGYRVRRKSFLYYL